MYTFFIHNVLIKLLNKIIFLIYISLCIKFVLIRCIFNGIICPETACNINQDDCNTWSPPDSPVIFGSG